MHLPRPVFLRDVIIIITPLLISKAWDENMKCEKQGMVEKCLVKWTTLTVALPSMLTKFSTPPHQSISN